MIQGDPNTIHEFLLNADDEFPVELGRLDFEDDKKVQRDVDGAVLNNSSNRQLYRENGLDNVVETIRSFDLGRKSGGNIKWGIRDEVDNLYAETVFRPTVEAFFSSLPDVYAPNAAEILIQNSGRADECVNQILDPGQDPPDPYIGGLSSSDRETLTECYLERIFQAVAIQGLVKTFPILTDPDGGTPIPIFNILPKNAPNGFSRVFISTLVPSQDPDIFEDVNFTVSNLQAQNRFVWTTDPNNNLESKLESVFNPRATANDNVNDQDIRFNFPGTTTKGSTGSVLFVGELGFDGDTFDDFEVTVDAGQGNLSITETVPVEWGRNAYVRSRADDLVVHDFSDDPGFSIGPMEVAEFETFTIDNDEQTFDIQSTSGSITDPQDLADLFNNELGSEYVTFEVSGLQVVATGDAFHFDFESPFRDVEETANPIEALVNLQLFVPGNTINSISASGGETFQNTSEEEILRSAPFFDVDGNEDWKFVSRELAVPPQEIDDIEVEAKKFDPDLGVDNAPDPIVDKALNNEYQGFSARAVDYSQSNTTRNPVDEGKSILGDLHRFFKDYVETNFRVIHVGLSDGTPTVPIASAPQPLTVELDRFDD